MESNELLPKRISNNNEVLNPDCTVKPEYRKMLNVFNALGDQFPVRWYNAKYQSQIDGFTFPLIPRQWRVIPTDWLHG